MVLLCCILVDRGFGQWKKKIVAIINAGVMSFHVFPFKTVRIYTFKVLCFQTHTHLFSLSVPLLIRVKRRPGYALHVNTNQAVGGALKTIDLRPREIVEPCSGDSR